MSGPPATSGHLADRIAVLTAPTAVKSRSDFRRSTAFAAIRLITWSWAVAILPIGLLIVVTADTWTGRVFALWAIVIGLVPLGAVHACKRSSRRLWRATTSALLLGIGGSGWMIARAPNGEAADPRVSNHYPAPSDRYPRLALSNLLPEEDQLLAGFTIAPLLDPILTTGESAHLKQLTRQLYRELESDGGFHALGSAMRFTYADMFGQRSAPRHCYTYVPAKLDRGRPAPLLVFFHGSGGNFKAYLWILAKVADETGAVVVSTTGGFGEWPESECEAQFTWAIEAARTVAAIDPQRIHLMGVSNGGLAVSRLTRSQGERFASVIWLSPVFDSAALESHDFAAHCRAKPMLVISGARDDRVPLDYVRRHADVLNAVAARVEQSYFESADHFLIFSHRNELTNRLAEWFKAYP